MDSTLKEMRNWSWKYQYFWGKLEEAKKLLAMLIRKRWVWKGGFLHLLAKAEIFGDDEVSMSNFIFLPQILGGGVASGARGKWTRAREQFWKKWTKLLLKNIFSNQKKFVWEIFSLMTTVHMRTVLMSTQLIRFLAHCTTGCVTQLVTVRPPSTLFCLLFPYLLFPCLPKRKRAQVVVKFRGVEANFRWRSIVTCSRFIYDDHDQTS